MSVCVFARLNAGRRSRKVTDVAALLVLVEGLDELSGPVDSLRAGREGFTHHGHLAGVDHLLPRVALAGPLIRLSAQALHVCSEEEVMHTHTHTHTHTQTHTHTHKHTHPVAK